MKTFFIISGVVLWALIITLLLYLLYDDIKNRLIRRKQKKIVEKYLNS